MTRLMGFLCVTFSHLGSSITCFLGLVGFSGEHQYDLEFVLADPILGLMRRKQAS